MIIIMWCTVQNHWTTAHKKYQSMVLVAANGTNECRIIDERVTATLRITRGIKPRCV